MKKQSTGYTEKLTRGQKVGQRQGGFTRKAQIKGNKLFDAFFKPLKGVEK